MIHSSKTKESLKDRGFPKLCVRDYDGLVVLFTDSTTGTVVYGLTHQLGWHNTSWTYGEFKDYEGGVVLENN